MSHPYILYINIFLFFYSTIYIFIKFLHVLIYVWHCVICVILVQKIYKNRGKNGIFSKFVDQKIPFFGTSWGVFAFFSQNHGKSALMIMVNVTAVIFFGKSVKNIWNLDFFKYNHKYETVKQSKQSEHGTVSQSNSRAVHNS